MKNFNSNLFVLSATSAVLSAFLLTACGGGGGDDGTTTSASDPIDKYVGVYVEACKNDPSVSNATTGAPLHIKRTQTFTKSSSVKAAYRIDIGVFNTTDCSGTAVSTITVTDDTYFQIDGTEVIGSQTVDKTTASEGVYFRGLSAGTSITVNGVRYEGAPYTTTTPQVYKDLALLQGNVVYGGDFSKPLDAQGYPTALSSTSSPLVKQ